MKPGLCLCDWANECWASNSEWNVTDTKNQQQQQQQSNEKREWKKNYALSLETEKCALCPTENTRWEEVWNPYDGYFWRESERERASDRKKIINSRTCVCVCADRKNIKKYVRKLNKTKTKRRKTNWHTGQSIKTGYVYTLYEYKSIKMPDSIITYGFSILWFDCLSSALFLCRIAVVLHYI